MHPNRVQQAQMGTSFHNTDFMAIDAETDIMHNTPAVRTNSTSI